MGLNSKNPFRDDIQQSRTLQSSNNDVKIIERQRQQPQVSTIESSINQPHVVQRRYYSEEEVLFKDDIKEIQENATRNLEPVAHRENTAPDVRVVKEKVTKSKLSKSVDAKEQKGILIFNILIFLNLHDFI